MKLRKFSVGVWIFVAANLIALVSSAYALWVIL